MENRAYDNPVKGRTPREGNSWWILVVVLVIAAGIFWAMGRSDDGRDAGPVSSPVETRIAEPDRTDNDVRRDTEDGVDLRVRDEGSHIGITKDEDDTDVDADIRIEDDNDRR